MPSPVIPCLLYRDAPAMIDWLCATLGFRVHARYDDDQGGVAHAELILCDGMVMIGSTRETGFGSLQSAPAGGELGGAKTAASIYLALPDADAVEAAHDAARAAGARIEQPLSSPAHGGRAFALRDPEGALWSLGSYDPWAPKPG